MKHVHSKERIKKMCDLLGEDFDSPKCQAMAEQVKACPTCKVYFDTVKKTVLLCKEIDCDKELPSDVNNRLMKLLDL
jgi:hypothetical protein